MAKYVNMTDIIRTQTSSQPASAGEEPQSGAENDGDGPSTQELMSFAELLFFAYRDFISDPDVILDDIGYGRAHHRVLHFVNRNPGLRVADLLKILKITKQSLARVLKQLIDDGYIRQKAGESDRRERLLYPTEKGLELAACLAKPQLYRISRAVAAANDEEKKAIRQFLRHMISEDERLYVANLIVREPDRDR